MQPSSMQPCPRCNTALPANARFCRNCGLTLTPAQPSAQAVAPYQDTYALGYPANQQGDPASNAAWPPEDQYIPNTPINNGGWSPPSQQGGRYASYDDDAPPKRSFWRSFWGIVVIASLVIMVVGVSLFAIYAYPTLCSVQARQGLRQD